jgi:hypothetical protein
VSLEVRNSTAEAWQGVLDCPNLKYLKLDGHTITADTAALNGGLKKSLKKLASLKVGGESYRLGTDWGGY